MKAEDESGTANQYMEYFGDMQIQAYAEAKIQSGRRDWACTPTL